MSERIDHAAEARRQLTWADGWFEGVGETDALAALMKVHMERDLND